MSNFYLTNSLVSNVNKNELLTILFKQIENIFSLNFEEKHKIKSQFDRTLTLLEKNISGVKNKYYSKNEIPFFNPYHSGQYLTFLYYLSNIISSMDDEKNEILADKIYYLNKVLNSVDIYHKVQLPSVFFFEHPLGSVLGRADYGNNFFMMQGCTIGGTKSGYPILGQNVSLFSNSKIIGKCIVGNNVILSANAFVKDTNIEANKIVFGQHPNLVIKENNNLLTQFKSN